MTESQGRVISRRFSRLQKAVALAPVLLLLVYLPGQTTLRCRTDGLLRPACCCPHADEAESAGPVVKAQDCCDREVAQSQRPTAVAARAADRELASATAATVVVAALASVAPPTDSFSRAAQRQGPVREGPPIVLLKHAFLI
jgi:hypothetical protein